MVKTKTERLGVVLDSFGKPGTCEAALAILKGMSAAEQSHAAAQFPTEIKGLALQYPRFTKEAPIAAKAAEDAVLLGL